MNVLFSYLTFYHNSELFRAVALKNVKQKYPYAHHFSPNPTSTIMILMKDLGLKSVVKHEL